MPGNLHAYGLKYPFSAKNMEKKTVYLLLKISRFVVVDCTTYFLSKT